MKLLLVEDEEQLSQLLAKGLKKLSYAVDTAFDGREALEMLDINTYDLIILDINIPHIDGFEVLKTLRQTDKATKVLILSAKDQVADKVTGLNLGANDYLQKPFDFLELSARIGNLLRWSFSWAETVITVGRLTVDTAKKVATYDDILLPLTNKEYGILEYLALHKGNVISAERLIEHVWDSETDLFSNSFKFHIHSLKKKLPHGGLIKNIRNQGYCLLEVPDET